MADYENLLKLLNDDDWTERNKAVLSLGDDKYKYKNKVLDSLISMLDAEKKTQVRKNIVKVLGNLQVNRAVPALEKIIADRKEETRVRSMAQVSLDKLRRATTPSSQSYTAVPHNTNTTFCVPAAASGSQGLKRKLDFETGPNKAAKTSVKTSPSKDTEDKENTTNGHESNAKPGEGGRSAQNSSDATKSPSKQLTNFFPKVDKAAALAAPVSPKKTASELTRTQRMILETVEEFPGLHRDVIIAVLFGNNSIEKQPNYSALKCWKLYRSLKRPSHREHELIDDVGRLLEYNLLTKHEQRLYKWGVDPTSRERTIPAENTRPAIACSLVDSTESMTIEPMEDERKTTTNSRPDVTISDANNDDLAKSTAEIPASVAKTNPANQRATLLASQQIARYLTEFTDTNGETQDESSVTNTETCIRSQLSAFQESSLTYEEHTDEFALRLLNEPLSVSSSSAIVTETEQTCSESVVGLSMVQSTEIIAQQVSVAKPSSEVPVVTPNRDTSSNSPRTSPTQASPVNAFAKMMQAQKTKSSLTPASPAPREISNNNNNTRSFQAPVTSPSTVHSLPSSFKTRGINPSLNQIQSSTASSFGDAEASTSLVATRSQLTSSTTSKVELKAQNMFSQPVKRSVNQPLPAIQKVTPSATIPTPLSSEQQKILDKALQGQSLFFTGAAGTGKSYVLRELVRTLRSKHSSASSVFVTAPTGIAACNIGGCTIHSWSGIGLGRESKEALLSRIQRVATNVKRWKDTRVLIIDEVSMLSAELFDKLDYIARAIRKRPEPFGGIQVIMCGDFFQLPPVGDDESEGVRYCFEADCWSQVVPHCYELKQIWRQSDQVFVSMLNEVRKGQISNETLERLMQCRNTQFDESDGIKATMLYPHKVFVEQQNNQQLIKLEGEIEEFKAHDHETYVNGKYLEGLRKNCPAPEVLQLKIGAQVMLLKNLNFDRELVNGARGKVVGFDVDAKTKEKYPIVLFTSKQTQVIKPEKWSVMLGSKEVAYREQIPLTLAWAMSIHKSQGMTIDRVEMDLSNVFAAGQAYVALSRATSLSGLKLLGIIDRAKIKSSTSVVQFYARLKALS